MKKINGLALSVLTATFLVGCGGGGGSSSSTSASTIETNTSTEVIVERGALLGATVKDANGQESTSLNTNSNVYIFTTTPVYPITATGGYIDVNADGIIDTNDVAFTGILKSYSTVVTPITTYIATGVTEADRTAKLAELKAKIGGTVSDDDLLKKVPSTTTADIIVLTNAIYDSYSVLFDTDTTNDDVSSVTTLDDKITSYKSVITQSGMGKSVKELAKLVEEELITTKGISKLTNDDISVREHSSSIVFGKVIVSTDIETVITSLFDFNGNYSERVYNVQTKSNYSCGGLWKDLGNNKIGITCAKNGTSIIPDGIVDSLESKIQLSSSIPVENDKVSIIGRDGQSYEITIKKTYPIFQSGEKWKDLIYKIVTSPITGKQWLDRNLGAFQSTDSNCYGDYYQWGRLSDGHEKVTSLVSSNKVDNLTNIGSDFITASDWTIIDNNGIERAILWSKIDGTGVCPVGFRVPTKDEVEVETLLNNNVVNGTTAFTNFLKLPVAGIHSHSDGSMIYLGLNSSIWTTSLNGLYTYAFSFGGSAYFDWYGRARGIPVRCIKNN